MYHYLLLRLFRKKRSNSEVRERNVMFASPNKPSVCFFGFTPALLYLTQFFSMTMTMALAMRHVSLTAYLFHVEHIHEPDRLCWMIVLEKRSKTILRYIPCQIRVNLDERMNLPPFKENEELIQFIGINYFDKGEQSRVTKNLLVPYYHGNEGDRAKWSPKLLQTHLDHIKGHADFKKDPEFKLLLEAKALQCMLNTVLARHEDTKKSDAAAAAKEKNRPVSICPWKSPCRDSPEPTSPGQHVPFGEALPKQKLRAGDTIEYMHPVFDEKRCSVIMLVNQRRSMSNNVALEMVDSSLLGLDCRVRLVLRLLNGKHKKPFNTKCYFEGIRNFKLDAGQNGKVQIVTKAVELGRGFAKSRKKIGACQANFAGTSDVKYYETETETRRGTKRQVSDCHTQLH